MYKILEKIELNSNVIKMVIEAPLIANKCLPGQFVILRTDGFGERIPLTINDYDRENGTVTIVFQVVGMTTKKLSLMKVSEDLYDFVGPLGRASELENLERVLVIGGGVGCAIAFPIAKELFKKGKAIDVIVGFRNKELVILEEEFKNNCTNFYPMSDDGSYGEKGLVTEKLESLLLKGNKYDRVYAIGPLPMMKYVSRGCEKYNVPIVVSMNSIMIDGSGMCGCCRLTVNGETKFACVDGPEFWGNEVDFDEAILRNKVYQSREREKYCKLMEKINE